MEEQQRQTRVGVLATLRSGLLDGTYPPGSQLKAVELARQMRVSQTPIREALARLTGEGLLVDRPRHGYFVPVFSAELLSDLYDLSQVYLTAALAGRVASAADDGGETGGVTGDGDPFGRIFAAILGRAENELLAMRGAWPIARLRPVRLLEPAILPDRAAGELAALRESLQRDPADAAAVLARYHMGRKAAAPLIARWLRQEYRTNMI